MFAVGVPANAMDTLVRAFSVSPRELLFNCKVLEHLSRTKGAGGCVGLYTRLEVLT
jgi:hypothetical protein